jgi:HlyD family secretion protein
MNYLKSLFLFFSVGFILFSCGKKLQETTPVRKDITETVFASGVLVPEDEYNLTAQSEGYIIDLKFDEGDTVKKDQVLALIDNKTNVISATSAQNILGIIAQNSGPEGPTLKQAEQNVELLKEKAGQDSIQLARYKKLIESNSVSKLELENTKLAYENSKTNYLNAAQNYRLQKQQVDQQLISQKSLRDINSVSNENNEVRAVLPGKIYSKIKQIGDYVRRGDIIAVIGSAEKIYTKLSIDETNISKIKVGQKVIIQLNTNKEKNYNGIVTEIYSSFDEQTQSFYCKVYFSEKLDFKISGTQLQANIIIGERKNALVIPRNFLGYGNKVAVKGKGDIIIEPGFISNDWVEIKKGLDENTIISTDQIK